MPEVPLNDVTPPSAGVEDKPQLRTKAATFIERSLGKALPNSAFDFGLILSIITTLIPVITGCFGSARRVKHAVKTGDDAFIVANFRAAHQNGLSPAESVRYALAMKEECKAATDDEIEEFIQLASESSW
jgi:hypothetical protein